MAFEKCTWGALFSNECKRKQGGIISYELVQNVNVNVNTPISRMLIHKFVNKRIGRCGNYLHLLHIANLNTISKKWNCFSSWVTLKRKKIYKFFCTYVCFTCLFWIYHEIKTLITINDQLSINFYSKLRSNTRFSSNMN